MSGIILGCSMKKETKKRKRAESKRRKTMISERLKKESFELFAKLQKLAVFIGSERYKKLSLFHRYLLRRQFHFMRRYLQILRLRQKDLTKQEDESEKK